VVVVSVVKHCGMVYEGVYVVGDWLVVGRDYSVSLTPHTGFCRLSSVSGSFLDGKCYYGGCMVLKLAENADEFV
jgi:hypothetical protein